MNVGSFFRGGLSLVLAVAVGFGLFLGMTLLISTGLKEFKKSDTLTGVDFVRLKREDAVETKKRFKKKPPPPKEPPPPPKLQVQQAETPQTEMLQMDIPRMDLPLRMGGGPFMGAMGAAQSNKDGGLIPLVTIAPMYPRKALMNRIEGYVIVEFTVTKDGTVKDPKILEANPRQVFNQAALRTILRYKFKPVIVDGQPQESRASWRINFEIEE